MTDASPHVLLVEDDQMFGEILTKRFLNGGATIMHVESGKDAIAALEHEKPFDVILLDVSLPDMDGFQILSRIRTVPAFNEIPVVIVSNFVQDKDIDWGRKMGVVQFIQKSNVMPGDIIEAAFSACAKAKGATAVASSVQQQP